MVYCEKCGWVPVPEKELPVLLPTVAEYEPTDNGESPLSKITDWVNTTCPKCGGPGKRETDTMPNWAGSSWYWLRYMDAKNEKDFVSSSALKYWGMVDYYNGGMEHATRHLLYARFWHQFLFDQGLVPTPEPFKKRVAHGMILGSNGEKMSKSKGNVMYADDLVATYGVDAIRYYVLHEIPFASDGNLTYELVCEKNNSDLANTYGNLVNRTMAMGKKYFDGNLGKGVSTEFDSNLENRLHLTIKEYYSYMDKFRVADAIESVMVLLRAANKYIDEVAPWVLAKDSSKKQVLEGALYHLFEVIRIAAILLEPIMPSCSKEIYSQINTTKTSFKDLEYGVQERFELQEAKVLFKRLDVEKDVLACVLAKENAKTKTVVEQKPLVGIEDFDKLDLGVGMILEAKKHPKADKLLVFKVDIGGEVRQIVSGIAKFYDPSLLIGKKVVVVKNLKPILLRGEESYGMLLCASNENDLELLNVEKLPSGAQVS